MKENRKLLREVLKDIRHDMTDEEVLNLLADSKISENLAGENEKYTLGQRAADAIAKFAGSWAFIFSFTGVLILWMLVNTLLAAKAAGANSHSASTSGSASSASVRMTRRTALRPCTVGAPRAASAGYSACDTAPPTKVAGAFR